MGAENDKIRLQQSTEIQKNQKNIDIKDTIDNVFSAAPKMNISAPEKEEIEKVLKDSGLNFSKEQTKTFLNRVKELANKSTKKMSLMSIVNGLVKSQKKKLAEKKDIQNNPTLPAISNKLEIRKQERENERRINQINNAAKLQQQKTKDSLETKKKWLRDSKIEWKRYLEEIKAAKESYQNLSPELKQHSPEEINTKINALSPNTKARLKKSGLSLSDYAQFSLAREKITSLDTKTPEGETFLTTLKKMEKSLGIVEKTDGGYPLSNEPRKETFEQNPQLMEFAKNDESLKSLEKVNVLDDKLNIKQQQKIFQLFWDADQKRFFEQILPLLERKKKADLDHSEPWFSAEEIAALQQYQVHFDWLKKKFTDKNMNYLKAAATQAPLVAILRYLDQDSLGKQTLADLMQKEGGEYATIEQHQDLLSWAEDKIMKIKWTIKGKPISIYYNLSDPNATLQCDDYLYTDPNTGQLSLWATGKRTDLNIKMPTSDTIADQLGKECSTEAFWEMIDAADTPHEYNEKLSLLVSSSIDNFFVSSAEEPRISERIARDAEKNVWVQLFTSGLIPAEISAQLNTGGELNTNPELRNLFRCLDKTSESLTTDQLKRLIASIEKLTKTLNSPDEIKKISDPVLRDTLTQLYQATKEKKSDLKARSSAMLSFFNLFTRQDLRSPSLDPTSSDFKLNISDLSATLHHLSSGLPLDQNGQLSSFSQDFRNNYEAQKSSQSEHSTADIEADLELAYG